MPTLPQEILEKVLKLRSLGISTKRISHALGYPLDHIKCALKLIAVPKLPAKMLMDSIFKLWRAGYSMTEIAKLPHYIILKERDGTICEKYVALTRVSYLIARKMRLEGVDILRQEELHAYARKQHKLRKITLTLK